MTHSMRIIAGLALASAASVALAEFPDKPIESPRIP